MKPLINNLEGVKILVRYLLSTKTEAVRLKSSTSLNLEIFTDASYRDPLSLTGKSQSRAITTVGRQIIKWWTRRQDIVVLLIIEVEYIANYKGAKDAACL